LRNVPELRSVIVTGASRGLGLGIAKRLAADGFQVIAISRHESEALGEAIGAADGRLHHLAADLSDIDALGDLHRAVKKAFGPIYGLVNNAGGSAEGLLANLTHGQIEALIRLNTTSPIILTKYVARGMMAAGEGRIVNMSSIMASTGFNGLSVYGATKASLVGFTKSLARELGGIGVTVNAVAPGFINTELTAKMSEDDRARIANRSALRRLAEAEDVAAAVGYLMGDGARNVTGTVLTVDAGSTA
jgi:3-oxoacyl-[acyl-carrier protein] reductase